MPKYFHVGGNNVDNAVSIKQFSLYKVNPYSMKALSKEHRLWEFIAALTLLRPLIRDQPHDFGRFSPDSGKDHLNISQLKTYFKVMETRFSPKSFQYFINCKDNHKSGQGFDIFLQSTIMELVHLFCANTTSVPTPLGFLEL